jgi:hypothetical protein
MLMVLNEAAAVRYERRAKRMNTLCMKRQHFVMLQKVVQIVTTEF